MGKPLPPYLTKLVKKLTIVKSFKENNSNTFLSYVFLCRFTIGVVL